MLAAIDGLIDTANEEYGAAIANNKIVENIEYQDSCGFVLYAQDAQELYEGISDKIQTAHPEEHKAISSSMSELAKACPSLIP
ncbi:MAG: hypothetical protein AAFR83_23590 [Cyanobacteria bacterium J06629_18]